MKRTCLINFVLLFAGISAAILVGEITVRLFWKNAPMAAHARDDKVSMQSPDVREGKRYIPNAKGYWRWTLASFNSQGLRDREFPGGKTPGVSRIMVLGDSFIFGVGIPLNLTFPKALEKTLNESGDGARFEAVNAGVAGHNFNQEIASLRRLAPHYRPDIVIISVIYNDTELHGFSDAGWVPVLDNYQKDNFPQPSPARLSIYNLMLPENEESLSERLRYSIANLSRLYLFVALRLRSIHWIPTNTREIAQFKTPACQNEPLLWGRFRKNLDELKRLAREHGFRPVVFFYTDLFMEGGPILRMREAVEDSGLPLLDLSYLWKDRKTYVRKYSLKWDFHPSAYSFRLAADATAGFLAHEGVIPSNEKLKAKFNPDEYTKIIKERSRYHRRELKKQKKSFRELSRKFASEIDFEGRNLHADQLLHGWWEEDFSKKMGSEGVRWGALEASIIIRNPGNSSALTVEGLIPRGVHENVGVPDVTIEIDCGAARVTRPVGVEEFSIEVPLPERYADKPLLEVSISSDIIASPNVMGIDPEDHRAVGFGVRRIRLR